METGREENASRERCPDFPREQNQLAKQGRCRKIRYGDGAIQRWRHRRDPRMEVRRKQSRGGKSQFTYKYDLKKYIYMYNPPIKRTGSGWLVSNFRYNNIFIPI